MATGRYSAQQEHRRARQICLTHLAHYIVDTLDSRSKPPALNFGTQPCLGSAFTLAQPVTKLPVSAVASKQRTLERRLDQLLARGVTYKFIHVVQDEI